MANGVSGTKGGGVVNQLQLSFDENEYRTPFPYVKAGEAKDQFLKFERREGSYKNVGSVKNMNLPVEEVTLSSLTNNQHEVHKDQVDKLLKLSIKQLEGINDGKSLSGLPYVLKYKNTYQIRDGHHRLSALWAKGAKKTKVRVLDLEKITE